MIFASGLASIYFVN